MEHFITNIQVNHLRGGVTDLAIPLSKDKRQHLIITGKNGSGKTSLLSELDNFLELLIANDILRPEEKLIKQTNTDKYKTAKHFSATKYELLNVSNVLVSFSNSYESIYQYYETGKFLLAYFPARRDSWITIPKGIKKIDFKQNYGLKDRINSYFLQYLTNLKADRSFARDEGDKQTINKVNNWFQHFENRLKYIFNADELALKFDRKTYTFDIVTNTEAFNFTHLSDGYSAIISIVGELILRMEAQDVKAYDLEGIVLIDEIETHLHIDLQKKILPFLTDFFPKIQFIVTTHSPFVLSSISNATVCDLENRIITTDLSNYSYDAIIESYFQADKYSEIIKRKIVEFEALTNRADLTGDERYKLIQLKDYFAHAPKHLAPELMMKLQEIRLNELTRQKSR